MTLHLTVAALCALVLMPPAITSAQSLAEVARQEAIRRQTVAQGKVFTNGDLKPVPPATPSAATPAAGTPPTPSPASPDAVSAGDHDANAASDAAKAADAGVPADAKKDDKKDEKFWRQRMAAARDGIARSQTFQLALESRVAALSTDFVNRDDPAQRSVIAADRVKAVAELERVKKELIQYQTELTRIAEEARRAGVPAGWVR